MLLLTSALSFSAESEVKVVGKCLKISAVGGQVQLVPLRSIISVKISPLYEENVGAADEDVKGYIEIVTTALVRAHLKDELTAVNERIRINGINFAEAKKFGGAIEYALAYSEGTDKG